MQTTGASSLTGAAAAAREADAAGGGVVTPSPEDLVRVVALDGPAGSGKSTVARLTAVALGWRFIDTGATYRAVTLAVLRAGVPLEDTEAVAQAAQTADVQLVPDAAASRVLLDGEDVSALIRGPEVTAAVSAVSAVPAVRQHLIALQRRAMGVDGAVVEGRDIATVVAPRAAVKVYLDARPEVRARRRTADVDTGLRPDAAQPVRGRAADASSSDVLHSEVQADLERRDLHDSKTNPLRATEGAVHLDTSDLSLEQVVHAVVEMVWAAGLNPADPANGEHA